jgi:predicted DNA-binding transcriptional regulator AlpA
MPNAEPQFYLDTEVEAITRTRDPTRKRMEIRGLFPRRIRISPRRNGWRRGEIEMWVENPEDWFCWERSASRPVACRRRTPCGTLPPDPWRRKSAIGRHHPARDLQTLHRDGAFCGPVPPAGRIKA